MGLTVSALQHVKRVRCGDPDECESLDVEDYARWLAPAESFPQQADGLAEGCYRVWGEEFELEAGAYSDYGAWRENLARLTGATVPQVCDQAAEGRSVPFGELIAFSDCDGLIGPRTSAKLLADFDTWRDRACAFAEQLDDGAWLERYDDFRRAFAVAAGAGCVIFQ